LPTEIKFANNDKIEYIYTATGEKIQKKVKKGNQTETTDYLDDFQYFDDELGFFPHSEGYVKVTETIGRPPVKTYTYVYNYTDHLGNIRMRYTRDPQDQTKAKILEEDHYYPFGLKHEGYNSEHQIIIPPFTPLPIYPTEIIPITPAFGEVY